MLLYHGTNIRFEKPKILIPNRALDFGMGFYTTSDRKQASDWANVVVKRSCTGKPLLNIYELANDYEQRLNIKKFENINKEWLDFICEHRLETYKGDNYDLIIGAVANDRTMPVLQGYMNAKNKDLYAPVALSEIQADRLSDQFVFKNDFALNCVNLVEVAELWVE
jgi:DNA-binding Xre family transcriptional regulator